MGGPADGGSGTPYLVPLSFLWDGTTLLVATPSSSPTSRNLQATGKGPPRHRPDPRSRPHRGNCGCTGGYRDPGRGRRRLRSQDGFDPRQLTTSYLYFRIHPQRLQAWREANELKDRELMRGGHWIVP
jgi:hypothetical protein